MLAREANGSDTLLRRYVYGQRLIFMSTTASNAFYYHYDPLGSVRNVTSSTGATQLTYDYEPYGAIRSSGGSSPTNLLKFTGEYNDPTGLYHLRARQYDPSTGRFTSRDPADETRRGSGISSYGIAAAMPTVFLDPSGALLAPSDEGTAVVWPIASRVTLFPPNADGLCAARPGYPLSSIGENNGGVATHKYKHRDDEAHLWQNENASDLNISFGSLVCAIFDGVVSPPGWKFGHSSEGLKLTLVGKNNKAFYQHLSGLAVDKEQKVRRGDVLGRSGCGSEGVPHLHLGLEKGNPEIYGKPYRKPVSGRACS